MALDLFDDKPANVESAQLGALDAPPPASETVLDVDRWGMRRAADVLDRWEQTAGGVFDFDLPVVADAHEALFNPTPRPAARPADARRAAWLGQMMETPEYRALHNQTALNAELAELGAAQVCREWSSYAEENPEKPDAPPPGSEGESVADSIARIRSIGKALDTAREEVSAARDSIEAGLGAGAAGGPIDPAKFREHFQRVRNDPRLRAIMDMAGKMRAMCRALQRERVKHGRDDVVGVELGADVGRLVPSELLALCSEDAGVELLALHRIAERRAMCREYSGTEKVGRGPIIVTVDESGSMNGAKVEAAKAMALALAWLAHHQRRWIMLAGYSGGTEGTRLIAPPGRLDPVALMDWCAHFYGGGNNRDVPIVELPQWYDAARAPEGVTDCIMVTDAICDLSKTQIKTFNEWRSRAKARVYGIVIGADVGPLAGVCDRTFNVPSLALDSFALSEVLSI